MICHATNDAVILVHGLAAPRWIMTPLARFLRQHGYRMVNWGYPSVRRSVKAHADRLRRTLAKFDVPSICQCHLVTHSMGGIVARCALFSRPPQNIGGVVMLAPPNHGSPVARWLAPALGFMCPPLNELSDAPTSFVRGLPQLSGVDIGIIAAAADAVVSVESTHLDGELDHLVLPGRHGLLPLRRDTAIQIHAFLRNRRFDRGRGAGEITRSPSENLQENCLTEKSHAIYR